MNEGDCCTGLTFTNTSPPGKGPRPVERGGRKPPGQAVGGLRSSPPHTLPTPPQPRPSAAPRGAGPCPTRGPAHPPPAALLQPAPQAAPVPPRPGPFRTHPSGQTRGTARAPERPDSRRHRARAGLIAAAGPAQLRARQVGRGPGEDVPGEPGGKHRGPVLVPDADGPTWDGRARAVGLRLPRRAGSRSCRGFP